MYAACYNVFNKWAELSAQKLFSEDNFMRKKNDMLSGNVIKSILVFAFPIMLSQLLQYNYAFVDNI